MQNKPHDDIKNICGAKTRKGTPCQQVAGWGTDHVGSGRCKLHGGKSTGPRDKSKLKENKNAEKHGLFTKYLPDETLEIANEIKEMDALDILWENISLQYATIIRSQRIMYVKNREDKTIERVGYKKGKVSGEDWEVQQAWDKQATFLKAQSRAMAELRNMIARYDELLKSGLATEEQKLRIKKLKVDIERVEGNEEELNKLDKLIEAIDHAAKQ